MKKELCATLVCFSVFALFLCGTSFAMGQSESGTEKKVTSQAVEEPAMAAIPPAEKSGDDKTPQIPPPSDPEMAVIPPADK